MIRRPFATLKLIAAIFLASAAASAVRAQTATPPASGSAPSQSTTPAQTPAPAPAPQKKIYTNDDMSPSHNQPDNSVAATKPAPNSSPKSKNKKDAKWYQEQIAKLQSQIPPLDAQIDELKKALAGEIVNETRHYPGTRIGDWKDQLAALEKKRQDILDKISALEDEGRHNGVLTSDLP
jgi:hypothetical protein